MSYVVVTNSSQTNSFYLTDTCNKPRIAVKVSDSTSYMPMKNVETVTTNTDSTNYKLYTFATNIEFDCISAASYNCANSNGYVSSLKSVSRSYLTSTITRININDLLINLTQTGLVTNSYSVSEYNDHIIFDNKHRYHYFIESITRSSNSFTIRNSYYGYEKPGVLQDIFEDSDYAPLGVLGLNSNQESLTTKYINNNTFNDDCRNYSFNNYCSFTTYGSYSFVMDVNSDLKKDRYGLYYQVFTSMSHSYKLTCTTNHIVIYGTTYKNTNIKSCGYIITHRSYYSTFSCLNKIETANIPPFFSTIDNSHFITTTVWK